ncbi:MAG: hypothetical protein CSA65_04395 [Proteobacteria bacterium]|nr:MAG: hypothetical protein CSA65_04395 [Pseudomonadota bacterium]
MALALSFIWAAPRRARAEQGTLDRLVGELDRKLATTLRTRQTANDEDLLLLVRAGAGMRNGKSLLPTAERLLLARLRRRGLKSVRVSSKRALTGAKLAIAARRSGAELLLVMTLGVHQGHLQLRGELSFVGASLWQELLAPRRGSLSFLHARVRVDAEVRAFFGKQRRVRLTFATRTFALGLRPVLALAAADLDNDGRIELAVLHPRDLQVLNAPHGEGEPASRYLSRAKLSLTGKRAAVRPRRAMGRLVVADLDGDRRREIYLRSSELARGQQLSFDGSRVKMVRELGERYPLTLLWDAGEKPRLFEGVAVAGTDVFRSADLAAAKQPSASPTSSPSGGATAVGAALPASFYRLASARVVSSAGPRYYGAAVNVAGRLQLLDGSLRKALATLDGVGDVFEIADLDDDGQLELVTSSAAERGWDDRLAVYRLRRGQLQLLWRSARLAGRVTALTYGDLDGDGELEIVAALREREGRCSLLQVD